jgi:hypothetical protein
VALANRPRIVTLSFQARYRCGHSGACCTAGWPIPVDAGRGAAIRASMMGEGRVLAAGALSKDASGTCGFYDRAGRRCTIHSRLGLRSLPVSCAHFPRRLLIEDDRIAIALSHYCPTAADLLFDPGGPGALADRSEAAIVEAPGLLEGLEPEGFDARGAWPPLLRPGVLAGRPAYRLWEEAAVGILARAGDGPEAALARLRAVTGEVVRWKPEAGSLEEWIEERLAPGASREPHATSGWGGFGRTVGRYLAAKAFGSWAAYQGDGLHAVVDSIGRALDVLREETSAAAARAGRPLDRALLTEAFRQADLRLLHLAED